MSELRNPDFDPDHVLPPEQLIALEKQAEGARALLTRMSEESRTAVQHWLRAEFEVARQRALAVQDLEFVECIRSLERRLEKPGCYLRDAELKARLAQALRRAHLRLVSSGRS